MFYICSLLLKQEHEKNIFNFKFCCSVATFSFAQSADKIITKAEVTRIETTLAADDMGGRNREHQEWKKRQILFLLNSKSAGLQTFAGANGSLQEFSS
jgi:hypothetical protein